MKPLANAGNSAANDRQTIREEVHQYRRDRILVEAAALFSTHGYSGASVEALAERIGVTKPFIYYYMKNKQEILTAICEMTIDLPLEAILHAKSAGGSPTKTLFEFVRRFTHAQITNQQLVSVFFREEPNLPKKSRESLRKKRREFDKYLTELLQEGVDSGEFQIDDVPIATMAIDGMVCWIFTWYRPNGRLSIDEVCDKIGALVLNMVHAKQP